MSQVRKDIIKRKREKSIRPTPSASHNTYDQSVILPQEEERYGYMPFSSNISGDGGKVDTFVASFMIKSIVAAILFFGVAIFIRIDAAWMEHPKQWTSNALTEEFPFASVNQWYQEKFGSPLALTPQKNNEEGSARALPVNGAVSQTFQTNGQGILINSDETTEVLSMENGVVIFAGNDPETNRTVIIQHPDRSKSIYGNLSSINVHQYQFVAGNQSIGEFTPTADNAQSVYFAIQKGNQFIDPVQVIKVDHPQ